MTDENEDFAAMFEASVKAKRIERGQTVEGRIVAIGPEVAFVDVGGKGEATIEIDELKNADGELEVAIGDRVQAVVVSTVRRIDPFTEAGARRRHRSAARRRVPQRSSGRGKGRTRDQERVRGAGRPAARLLPDVADGYPADRPIGTRGPRLSIPDHRVQGRRQEHRRLAACAARGRAAGQRRRDPAIRSSPAR